MKLESYARTITGRRDNNEDAVCAQPGLGLFVVADGMGGYAGGEVASSIAVDTIHELVRRTAGEADVTWPYRVDARRSITENELMVATRLAGERIVQHAVGPLHGMGATVVALRISRDGAVVAHVGDSRLYGLREGRAAQLTIDHSLAAELEASGHPPGAGFAWRHVVTRALGTARDEPELQRHDVAPGDVFLLCSDGLSEFVDLAQLAVLLAQPAEAACHALIDAAYRAGSRDNISAVVVRVAGC